MSGSNGQASGGGAAPSTVLHALAEIQMVPAATGATTITVAGTYYEPAGQGRLTSNAVYKRFIAVKVSAQSNTAGTISVVLRNVTAGTSGTPKTVVIAAGQENVEKAIVATAVNVQATNLGDVFTILVTHTILGSTVTLNSGGIMEADTLIDGTGVSTIPQLPPFDAGLWLSSFKYMSMSAFSTATNTLQAIYNKLGAPVNIGSPSSVLNSSITISIPAKTAALTFTGSGFSGALLHGVAVGISADNI